MSSVITISLSRQVDRTERRQACNLQVALEPRTPPCGLIGLFSTHPIVQMHAYERALGQWSNLCEHVMRGDSLHCGLCHYANF